MSADPLTRLQVVIRGRVQGVGFRWFVRETADRFKVSGWVYNRADGTVEAEVQADAKTLAAFVLEIKTGHPYARVETLETREIPAAAEKGFEIR